MTNQRRRGLDCLRRGFRSDAAGWPHCAAIVMGDRRFGRAVVRGSATGAVRSEATPGEAGNRPHRFHAARSAQRDPRAATRIAGDSWRVGRCGLKKLLRAPPACGNECSESTSEGRFPAEQRRRPPPKPRTTTRRSTIAQNEGTLVDARRAADPRCADRRCAPVWSNADARHLLHRRRRRPGHDSS